WRASITASATCGPHPASPRATYAYPLPSASATPEEATFSLTRVLALCYGSSPCAGHGSQAELWARKGGVALPRHTVEASADAQEGATSTQGDTQCAIGTMQAGRSCSGACSCWGW